MEGGAIETASLRQITTKEINKETPLCKAAHLDHEVLDVAVEGRAAEVPALRQRQKVLAGARRDVAVQLDVEVAQGGVQAQVPAVVLFCVWGGEGGG